MRWVRNMKNPQTIQQLASTIKFFENSLLQVVQGAGVSDAGSFVQPQQAAKPQQAV